MLKSSESYDAHGDEMQNSSAVEYEHNTANVCKDLINQQSISILFATELD